MKHKLLHYLDNNEDLASSDKLYVVIFNPILGKSE